MKVGGSGLLSEINYINYLITLTRQLFVLYNANHDYGQVNRPFGYPAAQVIDAAMTGEVVL